MLLALFTFIAWVFIIIFSSINKSLGKIKNIIMYFCINILVINLFTILTLNMKLIKNSPVPELYFCILIQRNIIIPFAILIYINLTSKLPRLKGIIAGGCVFLALFFIELLLKWLKIKIYTGWSISATAVALILLIIISTLLTKLLNRVCGRFD